jgi:hypothetical protein
MDRLGKCAVCLRLVFVTKLGRAARHSSWHAKGMTPKCGRYRAPCEGAGQPVMNEASKVSTPPAQEE